MDRRPLKLFIVAGEASGDALGGRVLTALQRMTAADDSPFSGLDCRGIGGPQMEAAGLKSLFPMAELSVMGVFELLPHIRHLLARIRETAAAVDDYQPDAVLTIDSPGFTHRLATRIANRDIPRIHYVAPTVWAWRPGRVHKFKAHFDHLMALLPFEPPYFEAVGLDCTFTGHSVLESGADRGNGPAFRSAEGIAPEATVICVLPGSRRGEVSRHLPIFREAAERLAAGQGPESGPLCFVFPTVPHLEDMVRDGVRDWPGKSVVVSDQARKYDAMAACNAALAASGTVSLELAMARVPMVIAYRIHPLTHLLVKRMIKVEYASLLNIIEVLEGRSPPIPEEIQYNCTPERLASNLARLLDGDAAAEQRARLERPLGALAPPDGLLPSEKAARTVLDIVGKRRGAAS